MVCWIRQKEYRMDTGSLLSGVLLGSLGIGYFIYGKRQGHLLALGCGLLLCILP